MRLALIDGRMIIVGATPSNRRAGPLRRPQPLADYPAAPSRAFCPWLGTSLAVEFRPFTESFGSSRTNRRVIPSMDVDRIIIVTACDENYVRGVAAAMRSAIDSLATGRAASVYVLDGGIRDVSKRRLERSWRRERTEVHWLTPDWNLLRDLPVSGHVTHSTYLRLLLAEMLPREIGKAIYLDADTIVNRPLEDYWSIDLQGMYCAAVQDAFVPLIEPALLGRPLHSMRFPDFDPHPIPNYESLGLNPAAKYFNAGIMLVNVERWRSENIMRRALACLHANEPHVRWWDQYALNILFSQQWKQLDPRWNQNSVLFRMTCFDQSPYDEAQFEAARSDPWVVHFDYKPKPWQVGCKHPFRRLYFKHLDRTVWRWWRPRRTLRDYSAIAAKVPGRVYQGFRRWRQTRVSPILRAWKGRLGLRRAA